MGKSFKQVQKEILDELKKESPDATEFEKEAQREAEALMPGIIGFKNHCNINGHNLIEIKVDNLYYIPEGSSICGVKVTT